MSASAAIRSLGELKQSPGFDWERLSRRSVKEELRENLLAGLKRGKTLFAGIIGYDDTVIPQLTNAILSRHNFILLGLRGQAKSRILRELIRWLDPALPAIAGCPIHDNPAAPLCSRCRQLLAEAGDDTPIEMLVPEQRYVEKLATPDVTIADLIGDVDPIRAARGGLALDNELTIHYGLVPRAHRGIFALNELPDLASKIQVGLFNILQEGDVQIKGYPIRLPLDLMMAFSANPEDYTARGKIITPLKDRIGSEIRTHYPATLEEGIAITEQEADLDRPGTRVQIPRFVREVIEGIAFAARQDKRVDKRSGVSQRLPITCLENAASNAERRAILAGEREIVVRIGDVYRALPALTGKLELEYEGEMRGADLVAQELIHSAIGHAFDLYFADADLQKVVQWFELGGTLPIDEEASSDRTWITLNQIQGLASQLTPLQIPSNAASGWKVAAAEFLLEGLCAHRRISRSEELGYHKEEKRPGGSESQNWREQQRIRSRRPLN